MTGGARRARVRDFQKGPAGFDAMILSPRAAGVGLTLTAANHVIHLSRWWNPAAEDQCSGRAHRIVSPAARAAAESINAALICRGNWAEGWESLFKQFAAN